MAKPKNTKSTKWKLIISSPTTHLTRENAVHWGKSYKLPYTVTRKTKLKRSSYPYSWELRVYQPTLWKGRKVHGSSDYGIPFRSKKLAMKSYMYGNPRMELVRIRNGAYIYVETPIPSFKALYQTSRTKPRKQVIIHTGKNGGLYFISKGRKVYVKKRGWAYGLRGKRMDVYVRK